MSNLIKCSDCGKKISIKAQSCPNCGAPTQPSIDKTEADLERGKKIFYYIIATLTIVNSLILLKDLAIVRSIIAVIL